MYDYKAEKLNRNLPTSCKLDTHPQQTRHEFGNIVFDSKFDSGNLELVEKAKANHFHLWVCNDCKHTQKATNYRTWFYFSVSGVPENNTLTFTVVNLNFQNKLFREGMTPSFKSSQNNIWQRVNQNIASTMENNETGLEITWNHQFQNPDEIVYFAFSFPFSLSDNDQLLDKYQEQISSDPNSNIYFNRCTLIRSKEDRKVELVTISSKLGLTNTLEKQIPNAFPDQIRPHIFKNKKVVFLSARVHPGETPSSHVLNGVFKVLLENNDSRSRALLDNYVFYCVPMINPDGVYRGHYRTDNVGQNLNRFYINPSLALHPSVYAIKELILQVSNTNRLYCYIDLHAHATKKGCFIYGNCLDLKDQLDTCLFPRLISLNSPYFEYDSCNFTEKNMYSRDRGDNLSKEGAGRVALYKATKLNLCFTLECNYNSGVYTNILYDRSIEGSSNKEITSNDCQYDQEVIMNGIETAQSVQTSILYTIETFENIGEGICDAVLDYSNQHPSSRLGNSPYKTLSTLRMRMSYNLLRIQPFRFCQYLRKMLRFLMIGDNLDKVLQCLWIFINTGIKNDPSDTSKPFTTKQALQSDQSPQQQQQLSSGLRRQTTFINKKGATNEINSNNAKQGSKSQERKISNAQQQQLQVLQAQQQDSLITAALKQNGQASNNMKNANNIRERRGGQSYIENQQRQEQEDSFNSGGGEDENDPDQYKQMPQQQKDKEDIEIDDEVEKEDNNQNQNEDQEKARIKDDQTSNQDQIPIYENAEQTEGQQIQQQQQQQQQQEQENGKIEEEGGDRMKSECNQNDINNELTVNNNARIGIRGLTRDKLKRTTIKKQYLTSKKEADLFAAYSNINQDTKAIPTAEVFYKQQPQPMEIPNQYIKLPDTSSPNLPKRPASKRLPPTFARKLIASQQVIQQPQHSQMMNLQQSQQVQQQMLTSAYESNSFSASALLSDQNFVFADSVNKQGIGGQMKVSFLKRLTENNNTEFEDKQIKDQQPTPKQLNNVILNIKPYYSIQPMVQQQMQQSQLYQIFPSIIQQHKNLLQQQSQQQQQQQQQVQLQLNGGLQSHVVILNNNNNKLKQQSRIIIDTINKNKQRSQSQKAHQLQTQQQSQQQIHEISSKTNINSHNMKQHRSKSRSNNKLSKKKQ